ncbi:hypothetical protein [Aurantibacillus circumpalustris]|uniref:hypothetical protein n=1 Tax=Aurantibacillus circumpalustris TaxID=3036359 RepID=UPI00295B4D26|nr:hypothetical protein [Aurantibacillus circumpalustris]
MKEKELVTALIADHIRNMKLLIGLEKIGFDPLDHYLSIPEIIFKIMGIEKSETIFRYYITFVELKCEKSESPKEAADEIYEDLVWMRLELKSNTENQ